MEKKAFLWGILAKKLLRVRTSHAHFWEVLLNTDVFSLEEGRGVPYLPDTWRQTPILAVRLGHSTLHYGYKLCFQDHTHAQTLKVIEVPWGISLLSIPSITDAFVLSWGWPLHPPHPRLLLLPGETFLWCGRRALWVFCAMIWIQVDTEHLW